MRGRVDDDCRHLSGSLTRGVVVMVLQGRCPLEFVVDLEKFRGVVFRGVEI